MIVVELMRRQGLTGEEADVRGYMEAFKTEYENVKRRRLKAVSPEVAANVRRRRLAVRLRMLLSRKKCGRKKGRLVLQGFMEPKWWGCGARDSPVVAASTLKAMVWRRHRGQRRRRRRRLGLSCIDMTEAYL